MKYFEEVFKTVQYPSGEWHLQLIDWPRYGEKLVANVIDFNGLAKCVVADRILTRNRREVDWIIPFMPFARDDRRNTPKDGMELSLALTLIEELGAAVVDPHSDVTTQKIKFFTQDDVVQEYARNGLLLDDPTIAIPDAGAAKKAYSWIAEHNLPYVQCIKRRDTATGKLSGFQIVEPEKVEGRNVVIIDDICDGGGTFIGLAKELKAAGARGLQLAVTHGLFTKGVGDLLNEFEYIYTLDTCKLIDTHLVKVSLQNIIERGYPL